MSSDMKTPALSAPSRLWTRGFFGLIGSQFAGAFNDNLLKGVLLVLVATGNQWEHVLGTGGTGWISVMLTGPFILFLGLAGQLADRYSKRAMVLLVRLAELPIIIIIGIGLLTDSPWLTIGGYLVLATQSAFFNPPKYGMIREVTGTGQLSRANGVISLATNVSIIAGTSLSGYLFEYGHGFVAAVLFAVTIFGVISAWWITPLPAMNPTARLRWNPFAEVIKDLGAMRPTPVWMATWIWSFFFMAAILLISAIPDMQHALGVTMSKTTLLLGAAGLGIGIGCAVAGWCSGSTIRNNFVKPAAIALAAVYVLMGTVTPTWWGIFILLMLLGVASGFFLVPLLAMTQRLAPPEMRGRWLAAANWLCYVLMSLGGLLYVFLARWGFHPQEVILVCGGIMAGIFLLLLLRPRALQFNEADYR